MENQSKLEQLTTSDLAFASYLYCAGVELIAIDWHNSQRVTFLFALQPGQKSLSGKWQSGTATVNALAFWNSYRSLKRMMYAKGIK